MPRVRIVPAVIQQVRAHPDQRVRGEFFKEWARLSECTDLRSWDEIQAVPAHDPERLPDDCYVVTFPAPGVLTYHVEDDDNAEIIEVTLPD